MGKFFVIFFFSVLMGEGGAAGALVGSCAGEGRVKAGSCTAQPASLMSLPSTCLPTPKTFCVVRIPPVGTAGKQYCLPL